MTDNVKQLGQIKNLIMVALADGKATKDELMLIAAIASRENITQEQLNELLENPDMVKITLPEDEETKMRYLTDMVALMTIDGVMDDNELAMCKLYAIALGYDSSKVENIVMDITECLTK